MRVAERQITTLLKLLVSAPAIPYALLGGCHEIRAVALDHIAWSRELIVSTFE